MEAYFGFLVTKDMPDEGIVVPQTFAGKKGVFAKTEEKGQTHYLVSIYVPDINRTIFAFLMDDQGSAGKYKHKQMFLVIRIGNTNSKYEYVAFSLPGHLIYTGESI